VKTRGGSRLQEKKETRKNRPPDKKKPSSCILQSGVLSIFSGGSAPAPRKRRALHVSGQRVMGLRGVAKRYPKKESVSGRWGPGSERKSHLARFERSALGGGLDHTRNWAQERRKTGIAGLKKLFGKWEQGHLGARSVKEHAASNKKRKKIGRRIGGEKAIKCRSTVVVGEGKTEAIKKKSPPQARLKSMTQTNARGEETSKGATPQHPVTPAEQPKKTVRIE